MTASYKKTQFAWWQPVLAVALLAAGVLIGRGSTAPETTSPQDAPQAEQSQAVVMAVEAVTPEMTQVEHSLDANGLIAAVDTAEVSGQLTGVTIDQVLVEEGDRVRAGQVLAVLDTRTLQQQTRAAEAELTTAQAAEARAAADLARTEPLLAIDAISHQEIDAYRTALTQAEANVAAAEANLITARTRQQDGNVTAPVDGIISAKNAQVGTQVAGAPLFSIIKNGTLEWQAQVAPIEASRIQIGQTAHLTIGDRIIAGRVTRLSPVANDSRDMTVHVRLPNDGALSAGMYQSGKFIFGAQTVSAVPISALMTSDGYDYVWRLTPVADGRYQVKREPITILAQKDNKIAANLPDDALIVASSVGFLNDNDLVTVASINGETTPVPTAAQ